MAYVYAILNIKIKIWCCKLQRKGGNCNYLLANSPFIKFVHFTYFLYVSSELTENMDGALYVDGTELPGRVWLAHPRHFKGRPLTIPFALVRVRIESVILIGK